MTVKMGSLTFYDDNNIIPSHTPRSCWLNMRHPSGYNIPCLYQYIQGSQFFLALKFQVISRFCLGQILQVLVQTILAPKGRCQRHSKIVGAQNLEKSVLI